MSPLQPGIFVQLHGLVNAPYYNSLHGLIVADQNDQGRYPVQLTENQKEWNENEPTSNHRNNNKKNNNNNKYKCAGDIIAVKPCNLQASGDSPRWHLANLHMTTLELITKYPSIGDEDDCYKFIQKVWDQFFEPVPALPLNHVYMKSILEAKGHLMFWLKCDAIMHHMLIEKCQGVYRVYQSYVHEDELVASGYTAREWCTADHSDLSPHLQNEVWKKYAGGRILKDADVSKLFDIIQELQDLIPTILPHLCKYVPGITRNDIHLIQQGAEKLMAKGGGGGGSGGDGNHNMHVKRASEIASKCREWAHNIWNNIGPLGITTLNLIPGKDGMKLLPGITELEVIQGNQFIFSIPDEIVQKVQHLMSLITGRKALSTTVFVRMVEMGIWWQQFRYTDGGFLGFAYSGANLDKQMTYQEGLDAAENIRMIFQDQMM